MKNEILVLMSTYNGEKYLREQIDSILAQEGVDVRLLVRDDGSTDSTLDLLEEYKEKRGIDYYTGENVGPQRSFMQLLEQAPDCDYYAFADQDDVWLSDKLASAVKRLEKYTAVPALYFSQTQLVDEELHPLQNVYIHPYLTFGESLLYKFASGCTMVFNRNLRKLCIARPPEVMPMHDMWVYGVAAAVGAAIEFDEQPHILYRQHASNVVGLGQGFLYEWSFRTRRFFSQSGIRSTLARQLYECIGGRMPARNKQTIRLFLDGKKSWLKRLEILWNHDLRCADRTTQILFWANLLLNKY